jgi:AcrR family transcriptional regulator
MARQGKGPAPTADGRSTRWDSHREARREELVEAAIRAIDEHGQNAGIAEVAAAAGVSKPVLYRYFTGKDDLYRAVGQWGAQHVLDGLIPALLSDLPIRERVRAAMDAYLTFIDDHQAVFLLLVDHRPDTAGDPLEEGKEMIAAAIARTFGDMLRRLGVDAAGAEPWAHGMVGFGMTSGEWWLRRRTMSKSAMGTYLSDFIWYAFHGIAKSYGVDVDEQGQLHLSVVEPVAITPSRRSRTDA